MHKSKDGTVTASLTEVKNKTGDIFHLVDEFGEVVLTSYNKPRYKITKIENNIFGDEKPAKKVKPVVKTERKIEETITVTPEEVAIQPSVEEQTESKEEYNPISEALGNPAPVEPVAEIEAPKAPEPVLVQEAPKMFNKTINISPWNRNSVPEKNFVNKAIKPLING